MAPVSRSNLQMSDDDSEDDNDEKTPLVENPYDRRKEDVKGWDVFIVTPPEEEDETATSKAIDITLKLMKVFVYILTFSVVIMSAVIAKGCLLFITSHIRESRTLPVCKKGLGLERDRDYEVLIPSIERVAWIWALFLILIVPEFFALFRSVRICVFKSYRKPKFTSFLAIFVAETMYTVGLCLLVFIVLPDLDVIKAAMLTNCVCFVPAVLSLLSRHSDEPRRPLKVIFDMLAIIFQGSALAIWPIAEKGPRAWFIPIAVVLVSVRWFENYLEKKSPIPFIKKLSSIKEDLRRSRYFTYIFISIWKMLLIMTSMFAFLNLTMENATLIFKGFTLSFRSHPIQVQQVRRTMLLADLPDIPTASPLDEQVTIPSIGMAPIHVALIQISAALICYVFAKFACKICIQGFSFAFPISLTIPISISMMIAACGIKTEDECFFEQVIPKYMFWTCPQGNFLQEFISDKYAWMWLLWLLSQTWIAVHIWTPKCERLASTEKLFVCPMYCGALIDQSLAMNRRRDDEGEIKSEELDLENKDDNDISQYYETISIRSEESSSHQSGKSVPVKGSDHITRIYACATMWHETAEEMLQMLKSVLRMDEDQCARRNAQKYLRIVDPDYYEFEVHVFFDDAYELCDGDDEEMVVNRFVKQLVQIMDTAASNVHQCNIKLKPPKKIPTPYGGKLVWTMPGKNKLIAHLKDKLKIRHRKRWSQVMYMYYLLGHRLMELPVDVNRKAIMAENTFILALDGDINFRPHAVQLLVDLMKKNRNLGAACGRIHPVGTGPMVWYQKFEYAIGHWLQKATEHMIGCVLCSPGCFSLFRAKSLMDDNVMKKYTTTSNEARHYVQYDQGEDRWLCTLLLQRGYRVEYSAASDAYTHCPEGFGEFYTQRRRWAPSTMANIMDLLGDYKATIAINDNISFPYIIYQGMLMVGTVLGPGTIFLMLVGAMVAAFKISNWYSFYYNIVPILIFMVVCFIFKNDIQILVAQVMSTGYALFMMAVLVGTSIQLSEDGVGSPSAIFLIALAGSFFIAALLHPQEFWCVVPGLLYFLSIPSMYLLLIIYSLVNLNVVTWGTREVQTKKTKKELEEEKKEQEELLKKKKNPDLLSFLGLGGGDNEEGSITLSFANLFTCKFFTYPKSNDDKVHLLQISEQLEQVNKKIGNLERQLELSRVIPFRGRKTSIGGRGSVKSASEGGLGAVNENDDENGEFNSDSDANDSERLEPKQERDDLINPYWIEDKDLKRGEVEYLAPAEMTFWKDLIEKYLYPLDSNKEHQARVAAELKELRNKVVFGFFMFNALFILIVFLMQLNKDLLHWDWPLGVKTNTTYIPETSEVRIEKEYLQLEPIGLVFAVFFALILVIQFTAMLFHRFGTLSHIMASIELGCFNQKVEDISDDAFIDKNAVQIAKQLQRLRGFDDDEKSEDSIYGDRLARRKTIQNLEKRKTQKPRIGTLDVAFRKRFMNINAQEGEHKVAATPVLSGLHRLGRSRETLRALELRRNNILGNGHKMETLGAKNDFVVRNGGRSRPMEARRINDIFSGSGHQNGHVNQAMSDESDIESGNAGRKLRMENLGSRNSLASYREESETARRRQSHL